MAKKMDQCSLFCSTNPNPSICKRDCGKGLRAVPINKAVDNSNVKKARVVVLLVLLALTAGTALYSKRKRS